MCTEFLSEENVPLPLPDQHLEDFPGQRASLLRMNTYPLLRYFMTEKSQVAASPLAIEESSCCCSSAFLRLGTLLFREGMGRDIAALLPIHSLEWCNTVLENEHCPIASLPSQSDLQEGSGTARKSLHPFPRPGIILSCPAALLQPENGKHEVATFPYAFLFLAVSR